MEKILSIIVPGYNVESTLETLLDSLISDRSILNKIEIVIVNDGSKDNTLEIANNYKNRYQEEIKVIDKLNGGHGSTINAALTVISGKYLQVIDGDDWVENGNFSQFVNYLSEQDADLILSPYRVYYEDTKKTEIIDVNYDHTKLKKNKKYDFDLISAYLNSIGMVSIVFRSDIFLKNNIRIDEGVFYDDNEFVAYPLRYVNTVTFYSEPVYVYRLGQANQSMASKNRWRRRFDLRKVLVSMIDFYEDLHNVSSNREIYIRRYISKCIDNIYEVYFSFGTKDNKAREEIKSFDSYLKRKSPSLYCSTSKKRLKFARLIRFCFYSLLVKNHRGVD